MDTNTFDHSFFQHVQTLNMINILHLLSISITFLCCYPYSLTQKSPSQKKRQYISFGIGFFLYCCSFITGWIIQLTTATTTTSSTFVTHFYLALSTLLFVLFCIQSIIEYNKHGLTFLSHHQDTAIFKLFTPLLDFITDLHEIYTIGLEWSILTLGYFYWISSLFVYTFTFDSFGQWYLPTTTGTGLLLYGSLTLLHLLNIIKLPRQSPSPEFYEAIFMLLWGFISCIWWDTPIILSSWKAINLGLLWTTGGLLSLVITVQSCIPCLQKRNIVNGLIICWTGKSILTSYAADDNYEIELQTTLGYMLITGGFARLLQVLFRKSTLDNLPKLYSRASSTFNTSCDDNDNDTNDDDTTCVDDLDIGQRRVNDFESTYRQLTGTHHDHHNSHNHSTSTSSCKHQSVFASITIVCGLLSCFMITAGGVLFIGTTSSFVEIIRNSIEDPSTYINVILAISFLWITYIMVLCSLYLSSIKSNHYNYSNLATSDLPISMTQPYSPQKYSEPNKMTTPTSSSTLYDASQQHFTSVPLVPLSSSPSSSSPIMATSPKNNNAAPSSPPMRPSQYRAKRRSLLISTAMQNNNNSLPSPYYNNNDRIRKTVSLSSVTGVGGILPDEIQNYDYTTSPVNLNHHQRFSGSSSTTLFSPPRPKSTSTMITSLSSSTTTTTSTSISSLHRHSWQQQQQQEYADSHSSSNETNSLHKTESGKLKMNKTD
ncbi:unnamed protein product [Cunninghamella echinulata]